MNSLLKHYAKLLLRPAYRRERRAMARLRKLPRFTPGKTDLLGPEIQFVDSASVISMYGEIFRNQIYRFRTDKAAPVIVDGGANIGMSIIYLKRLYPKAVITAFEPDTQVFEALENNVRAFGLEDVRLINKALWSSETELEFMHEGADGGRLEEHQKGYSTIKVPTVRLRDFLQQDVDFLKLDIEGAETEVLQSCRDALPRVRNLFVEYHSFSGREQTLEHILALLREAGFRYHIHHIPTGTRQPFFYRVENFGMDMQLNVFAYRPGEGA